MNLPVCLDFHDKRSSCADGAGNLGFNSFNFLTFVIMVFNAVANANNNINNNNNNNVDINLNSISSDTNNLISNSDNMNSIMVMIMPPPVGRKRRAFQKLFEQVRNFYHIRAIVYIKLLPFVEF